MNQKTLKKTTLIAYGQLAIPLAMIGLPLYVYIPTYYDSIVGISTVYVGLILFLARVTDVFTDPYFGYISDRCVIKFGSRKPMVIAGIFLTIIGFLALIYPINPFKELWLFCFSILIYIGWSLITIPYLTWSAEISPEYHHKTQLNSSREIFTIIGLLIALLIPFIFDIAQDVFKTLQYLFVAFIIILLPTAIISLKAIQIPKKTSSNNFSFQQLKNIYASMPQIKRLQLAYFLNNTANALPATLFLYFVQLVLQEPSYTGLLLIIYFLCGILALPFWFFLSRKIYKKATWMSSIILASCSFIFVIFLEAGDIEAFVIICIISGLSLGADMALPSSIQSDIVQQAQKVQSESFGVLFGIWSMITKFALAIAVAIGFIALGLFGFDATNPNEESILIITLLYGAVPVVLKVLTLYVLLPFKENVTN